MIHQSGTILDLGGDVIFMWIFGFDLLIRKIFAEIFLTRDHASRLAARCASSQAILYSVLISKKQARYVPSTSAYHFHGVVIVHSLVGVSLHQQHWYRNHGAYSIGGSR